MKFRDNSEDEIQYHHLDEEKSFLEHAHPEVDNNKQGWKRLASFRHGLTLLLLLISVTLNVVALLVPWNHHQARLEYSSELYGNAMSSSFRGP